MDIFFTYNEGNVLIKLFLAHFIADFLLQTTTGVADKKQKNLRSKYMWYHGVWVLVLTSAAFINSGYTFGHLVAASLVITVLHIIIDSLKIYFENKLSANNNINAVPAEKNKIALFIVDQLVHYITIISAWGVLTDNIGKILSVASSLVNNYKILILLLGYLLVVGPVTYLIKFLTAEWSREVTIQDDSLNDAGKWIGILERIIVVTLVLVDQYEAIGFLIAAKSLLRLTDKLDTARPTAQASTSPNVTARKLTEYVLIGTFLSFGFAMVIGFAIKWLMNM